MSARSAAKATCIAPPTMRARLGSRRWTLGLGGSVAGRGFVTLLATLFLVFAPTSEAGAARGGKHPKPSRDPREASLPARYQRYPGSAASLSVGSPNNGWQTRPKKLRSTRQLRVRAKSAASAYGHPALVLMLHRTAKEVAKVVPGSRLLVGDLSSERGGPLAGHASHQSGRDADVGFYVLTSQKRAVNVDRLVHFNAEGVARDGSGLVFDDRRNWLLVRMWLQDRRAGISHVFVSRGLRQRLLDYAAKLPSERRYVKAASAFLHQPGDSSPHDDHFHVRIDCPERQADICLENAR